MQPRVLILADHFGYAGGVIHGVTTYYVNILPRVQDRGIELQCCFLREEHPVAQKLSSRGVQVEFLNSGKWNPFVVRRIEDIARSMHANVIHLVGMKAAALGRWVARKLDLPVVIHLHDMNMTPWVLRRIYRALRTENERGLAVSAAAADCMVKAYGLERRNITVLPNAIHLTGIQRLLTLQRPQGLPDFATLIGWVGRLHTIKGPHRMIQAMAGIARDAPDVHLMMIGDGPERAACERLVHSLGLDGRVHFLGQRTDVTQLMGQMTLLCITSHNEGFSLVAAEAAAARLPVVAYAVGGLPEVVINGETGMLVPDGDEPQFIRTVVQLLTQDDLRRSIAGKAGAHAEVFDLNQHVTSLIEVYQLLASRGKPGIP